MQKQYFFDVIPSPTGDLNLVASNEGLHEVKWVHKAPKGATRSPNHPVILKAKKQLAEYFAGERMEFDLPLMPEGTSFQRCAWRALSDIPYGETRSYSQQAECIGDESKARAVGIANSKNPLAIVVPCHRVIGKNGSLTGFGGGLGNKKILLDLEAKHKASLESQKICPREPEAPLQGEQASMP